MAGMCRDRISKSVLHRLENGFIKSAPAWQLQAISHVLGVSIDALTSQELSSIRDIECYPVQQGRKIQNQKAIMHGHFHGSRFVDEIPEANFLFWLREPSQRLKSHFEFWNRLDEVYAKNPKYIEFKEMKPSFLQFATSKEFTNRQTLFTKNIPSKRVLKYGIVDDMKDSLKDFAEILGITPSKIHYCFKNKNINKEKIIYDIPKDELIHIMNANKSDYSLYNAALIGKLPKVL
mgnify:CR=1 FL=1